MLLTATWTSVSDSIRNGWCSCDPSSRQACSSLGNCPRRTLLAAWSILGANERIMMEEVSVALQNVRGAQNQPCTGSASVAVHVLRESVKSSIYQIPAKGGNFIYHRSISSVVQNWFKCGRLQYLLRLLPAEYRSVPKMQRVYHNASFFGCIIQLSSSSVRRKARTALLALLGRNCLGWSSCLLLSFSESIGHHQALLLLS